MPAASANVQEFKWVKDPRWAKLTIAGNTTQADVDALFTSVDTSNWVTRPTWDAANRVVAWQVLANPYGQPVSYGPGSVLCAERHYTHGQQPAPSTQAQVLAYGPGEWADSAVNYL